jgi:23S rRNA (uracil-5-)-methyltransferase RumA
VPAGYRTKAATPFAPLAKGRIARGFYERNSHKIAPCPSCLAEAPHARETLEAVAQVAEALHVRAYDEDRGRGILRAAICRVGWHSNEALLTLITNGDTLPQLEAFLGRLLEQAPWLTSVCQNVNVRKTNALLGPVTRTLAGPGYLTDSLLGTQFHVGPTSFYQTNPCATELLYAKALEGAALAPGMRVLDTYAGIGTIGLCAAHATSGIELTLVEKNAEAVRFARENARLNGLEAHTRCIADDATAWIRHESKVGGLCTSGFDVVIMDPARAGSTPEFISHVCALAPERVVYVSCNPTTHVRDLALFRERGWQVQSLCAVDLFAHTTHAESIAILGR